MPRLQAIGLALIAFAAQSEAQTPRQVSQPVLGTRSVPILRVGGLAFRDLDRSGRLDPFEDWRLAPDARARDLVPRMTLEEKAGAMMHGTLRTSGDMGAAGVGRSYDTAAVRGLLHGAKVNSMITRMRGDPANLAAQHNTLQAIAERTRLGIPLTISTDPRHHFQYVIGASVTAGQFSQWPEPLGFAAIGDAALMRRFGDIAHQEYRAVGIHMALSPQADLATEPRWSRINGTFGEDADLAGKLTAAYVAGFQGGPNGVTPDGVATVVKHWVGYGAAKDGYDSHSYYGRFATFSSPGMPLEYHARPFAAAFGMNAAGVMPTYSILQGASWRGVPIEPVGAAYNRTLLTDVLRGVYGFRGFVLTDWGITNDCNQRCVDGVPAGQRPSFQDIGMPWGVEDLPMRARFVRAVRAGTDQFGGTERADLLVEAVRAGELAEAMIDSSVARIMTQKFALGLFENPYVDEAQAASRVGTPAMRDAAQDAQRRSIVLLENRGGILPLRGDRARRVFLHGIPPDAVAREGWTVVGDPAQADVAIVRLTAPFERLHPGWVFGAMQNEGSLAFRDGDADYEAFKRASAAVPTIVTVYLDRPAILTPIRDRARALLANFGVSDAALMDVITGRARPDAKLPFEIPSSMAAVESQKSDAPYDSERPLYPFGFGRGW
jgi:beta-glucosidase